MSFMHTVQNVLWLVPLNICIYGQLSSVFCVLNPTKE